MPNGKGTVVMPGEPEKIKIICAMEKCGFQKRFFCGGKELLSLPEDTGRLAQCLFASFEPERITREMSARYEREGFVLIFRTDAEAVKIFGKLLLEHGGAEICPELWHAS